MVLLRGSSQIIRCWSGTREPETAQRQKQQQIPTERGVEIREDSIHTFVKSGIPTVSPLVSLCLSLVGDLPLQEGMHCSDRIRHVFLLTSQRKGLINAPDIDN